MTDEITRLKIDFKARMSFVSEILNPDFVDIDVNPKELLSVYKCISVFPNNKDDLSKGADSKDSSISRFDLESNKVHRVRIIGGMQRHVFVPLLLRTDDLRYSLDLDEELFTKCMNLSFPVKMIIPEGKDISIAKLKDVGYKYYSFYSFNYFDLNDREKGQSKLRVAEVPYLLGRNLLEKQRTCDLDLGKTNSPEVNIEFFCDDYFGELEAGFTLAVSVEPCPLTEQEKDILKMSKTRKTGYIHMGNMYSESELYSNIDHYLDRIDEFQGSIAKDTELFLIDVEKRLFNEKIQRNRGVH